MKVNTERRFTSSKFVLEIIHFKRCRDVDRVVSANIPYSFFLNNGINNNQFRALFNTFYISTITYMHDVNRVMTDKLNHSTD